MTTATLSHAFKSVGSIADQFSLPTSNRSVSAYKKMLFVTTNKNSVTASQNLLKHLHTICEGLQRDGDIDVKQLEGVLSVNENNLMKVNKMFDTIDNLLSGDGEVEIDDDNMLTMLSNMKQAQKCMTHIAAHLQLVLDVAKAKKEISESGKIITATQLIDLLKVA